MKIDFAIKVLASAKVESNINSKTSNLRHYDMARNLAIEALKLMKENQKNMKE
jgi:hypothetical protein